MLFVANFEIIMYFLIRIKVKDNTFASGSLNYNDVDQTFPRFVLL